LKITRTCEKVQITAWRAHMGSKETYISFRTSPRTRELLEKLARQGYRSLSQQVEMAVVEWLKSQGHRFNEEGEPEE
jgi:hypothetical protein